LNTNSFGDIAVPAWAYLAAETQRSLENFPIGGQLMPIAVVHALARVKLAAAQVNAAKGIDNAASRNSDREGGARSHQWETRSAFPLVVWQTGSGTQSNMNVNEVIANLANEQLGTAAASNRLFIPMTM
jgi:fumarate hydratase class II